MRKLLAAKRITLFLALALILSAAPAFAASGVTTAAVSTPGGKSVNLVTVDFSSPNRKPVLMTAGGLVTSDTAASNFLTSAQALGELAAMVNGAYFSSYYDPNAERVFPGNTALTQGLLVKDGRALVSGGSILLGYNGKWLMDKVAVSVKFTINGDTEHTAWGVNTYHNDPGAITLYTPEVGMSVPMLSGARGYVVKNGTVAGTVTSAFQPAAGETVIVVGPTAQAGMDKWDTGPKIGSSITFQNVFTPSRSEKSGDWANIELAIGAGPLLLQGGVNVAADAGINNLFQSDPKHQGVAQRTFIGVKADNTLVVGEGSCSYSDAAETLKAQGCIDAMALDGGASSFIHANGSTVQQAGRKLNNVLAIVDIGAVAPPPAAPPAPSVPAGGQTVNPTASTVYVNGANVAFDAYNIGGSNFFKLRDLAMALNGTAKQFEVGYDDATRAITLTTGQPYTTAGGELVPGNGTAKAATPTASKLYLNGRELNLTAYTVGGNNFFKLRDLMQAIDVYVGYDNATRAVTLDASRGYIAE